MKATLINRLLSFRSAMRLFVAAASIALLSMMAADTRSVHQFTMDNISGEPVSLSAYRGQVMLIVNTASKCGLTPQYKELEALYKEYKDRGLVILGFPANNFMGQEPGTNEEIAEFCQANYGVSFPMFSKISVKGDDMHPLYQHLTSKDKNGVMDSQVKWNFQKYLIDREGILVDVINPQTSVNDPAVKKQLTALLGQQ